MVETLQQFSLTNLTGTLIGLAILWAIWPIACGILGARRGQAMQGAVHGLLWGPIGLLIVLLSRRKYVCPTCGKKTLARPHEPPPTARLLPPPVLARAVRQAPDHCPIGTARIASPHIAPPAQEHPQPCGQFAPPPHQAPAGIGPTAEPARDEEEAAKLHAWVNAD